MKAARLLALGVVLAACGHALVPRPLDRDLVAPFVEAFREEATGTDSAAVKLYMKALETAAATPESAWQLPVVEASLDALVFRSVPSLSGVTEDAALVFRTKDAPLLADVRATGPFVPLLLARALTALAERRGDAREAEHWRSRTGCAREATVAGPLAWAAVTGVHEPDPLEKADAQMGGAYAAPGFFRPGPLRNGYAAVVVRGRGCAIDLSAPSPSPGVRDVVVDVDIPRHEQIGVTLRSHGEALLRVGGKVVLERSYKSGGGEATRFTLVETDAGRLRIVVRVGMDEDGESVEVDAASEDGTPLAMHAPAPGQAATVGVVNSRQVGDPPAKTDAEILVAAAAALSRGEGHAAERIIETQGKAATACPGVDHAQAEPGTCRPDLALMYARAVETARDLSPVHRAERARGAYERVLEVWPGSWEAMLAHAVLAGVRRGQSEARIETLRDLDERRRAKGASEAPVLDAFDAALSGRDELFDRATAAFGRARAGLAGTSLLVDAERAAFPRTGKERTDFECTRAAPHDQRGLSCYDALHAQGDLSGAARELERVRGVVGAPDAFLALSLRDALASQDRAGAERALRDMLPGETTLSALFGTADLDGGARDTLASRLLAATVTSRDAPASLPPLLRALGDDPAKPFEGVAEKLSAEDRAHPILPDAATAILAHTERYDIDDRGLVHAVMFDVRRVSGTTDVEENAQAEPPDITGRVALRVLRKRIWKRDGRVVEPDRAPHASQSHTDLSQLEAGDLVEVVYECWGVPDETGNVGIDTPDMLPERTAVHAADIEIRLPRTSREGAIYSHPLLGKPTDTRTTHARVLRWTMKDTPVRRVEEGTPKMDRAVSVSFSTAEWGEVARGLRETIATLDSDDSETAAWARDAVRSAGASTPRAKIDAVVEAAGVTVKESSPALLSDIALGHASGPQSTTTRTILADHEGSRTWLIVRALRELGIRAEIAIAENEPYSQYPDFPPHNGRFMHPLALAWPDGATGAPVWIDADVAGPPLPAGRISPELRGRSALHEDGTIAAIVSATGGGGAGGEKDEVDIRLVVDDKGDAKGTFTILLRGRDAQEIAEALLRTVGDERQRALRGVALAWVPFANVDSVALSSSEGSWQIALRAELSISAYAQIEGTTPATRTWVLPGVDPLHEVFPRAATSTLGATYVSQGQRETALAVSQAVQYHAHRRVELPRGAAVVRTPGPFEVATPSLEASRRIAVSGSVIEDDFVLGVPTGTIAADRYGAFVTDAHRTDDAFLASTRVKPPR